MRVVIVRSGGLAGLRQPVEVDTADLPEEEAARLLDLVAAPPAGTPGAGSAVRSAPRGADRFRYDVTVHHDDGERTLRVREGGEPVELSRLVAAVWVRARERESPDGPR